MIRNTSLLLILVALFVGSQNATAQDENNPWYLSVGVNAVDTYPVWPGERPTTGGFPNEFYNVDDHWNILPSISTIYVGRYIGSGFTFGVRGSLNKIEKLGDAPANDLAYYAVDGMFSYSFKDLLFGEDSWFDP